MVYKRMFYTIIVTLPAIPPTPPKLISPANDVAREKCIFFYFWVALCKADFRTVTSSTGAILVEMFAMISVAVAN